MRESRYSLSVARYMSSPLDSNWPKGVRGRKMVSFFSPSIPGIWRCRASDVEVSDLSISATNRPNRIPAWFRPTLSVARRSLPATDKRRSHFYSRVLFYRGRLKIRVLYYFTAFVRARLGVRICGDRKVLDRSFQREVFRKGKR